MPDTDTGVDTGDGDVIRLSTAPPYDPEHIVKVAHAAAEAIRVVNHATNSPGPGEGIARPDQAERITWAMQTLASRLPQTLTQLAAWERRALADGLVAPAADGLVAETAQLLESAAATADGLADTLKQAAFSAGYVIHHTVHDDEDQDDQQHRDDETTAAVTEPADTPDAARAAALPAWLAEFAARERENLPRWTEDMVSRARWARDHNEGEPNPAWSTGETIYVALVLGNKRYLDEIGYTVEEARSRLAGDLFGGDVDTWLAEVRLAI